MLNIIHHPNPPFEPTAKNIITWDRKILLFTSNKTSDIKLITSHAVIFNTLMFKIKRVSKFTELFKH